MNSKTPFGPSLSKPRAPFDKLGANVQAGCSRLKIRVFPLDRACLQMSGLKRSFETNVCLRSSPVETATRSRILDAAEMLLVQHGLEATTLRMRCV